MSDAYVSDMNENFERPYMSTIGKEGDDLLEGGRHKDLYDQSRQGLRREDPNMHCSGHERHRSSDAL